MVKGVFLCFFLLITVFHALIFVSECRFVIKIEFLSPTFFTLHSVIFFLHLIRLSRK